MYLFRKRHRNALQLHMGASSTMSVFAFSSAASTREGSTFAAQLKAEGTIDCPTCMSAPSDNEIWIGSLSVMSMHVVATGRPSTVVGNALKYFHA
jgi:hypothetical protein